MSFNCLSKAGISGKVLVVTLTLMVALTVPVTEDVWGGLSDGRNLHSLSLSGAWMSWDSRQ